MSKLQAISFKIWVLAYCQRLLRTAALKILLALKKICTANAATSKTNVTILNYFIILYFYRPSHKILQKMEKI